MHVDELTSLFRDKRHALFSLSIHSLSSCFEPLNYVVCT